MIALASPYTWQGKIWYSSLSSAILLCIMVLDAVYGEFELALSALFFAGAMALNAIILLVRGKAFQRSYPEWLILCSMAIYTLVLLDVSIMTVHWVYIFPIYNFMLFRIRTATIITMLYSVLMILMVASQLDSYYQLQVILNYLLLVILAFMHALVNENNQGEFKDLIHAESLIHTYGLHQFSSDLAKEIARTNRQQRDFLLVNIKLPKEWRTVKKEKQAALFKRFLKNIRQYLRLFDSCYCVDVDRIYILMPDGHSLNIDELRANIEQTVQEASELLESRSATKIETNMEITAEDYFAGDDEKDFIKRSGVVTA